VLICLPFVSAGYAQKHHTMHAGDITSELMQQTVNHQINNATCCHSI